jgi:hypothetical protein
MFILVVKHNVEKRAVNPKPTVVVNEAHFAEPIHETTDPRASGTYDLSQRLLAHLRNHQLLIAKVGQQEQHPRQTLLAGTEELVHQIFFNANVSEEHVALK